LQDLKFSNSVAEDTSFLNGYGVPAIDIWRHYDPSKHH